jgi:hypothetical protein
MSDTITSIGSDAFNGCTGLTYFSAPYLVTTLSARVIKGCTGIKHVEIYQNITSIGDEAMFGCPAIARCIFYSTENITFGTNVFSAGPITNILRYPGETQNTAFEQAVIAAGWTGTIMFGDAIAPTIEGTIVTGHSGSSGSVELPNTVTSIGSQAFSASGLTSIVIPTSVVSIGESAFLSNFSLTSILIPDSVESIGVAAFSGCPQLATATLPVNANFTKINNSVFYGTGLTSIVIPASVKTIGDSAFRDCNSLTTITIPSSVTSIEDYAFNSSASLSYVFNTTNVTFGVQALVGPDTLTLSYPGPYNQAFETAVRATGFAGTISFRV